MKTVFSNSQCAHVWAQQTQQHGRGSSVKFDGDTFYSYRTPIARIVSDATGTKVALCTSERYSVTTAKHEGHVRRALRDDVPMFTVPDLFPDGDRSWRDRGMSRFPRHVEPDHSGNVAHYLKLYSDKKAALLRVPAESWRLADHSADDSDGDLSAAEPTRAHSTLREYAVQFEHYVRAFALGLKAPDWRTDAGEVIARRDKLLSDPKRAKAAAARGAAALALRESLGLPADASKWQVTIAQRQALWDKQLKEREQRDAEFPQRLAAWRAGMITTAELFPPLGADRTAYLRVSADGAMVHTSLGADAPVSHVRPALAFYLRTVRDGLTYSRVESQSADQYAATVRLGHFTLDAINADGSVRAGCHNISAAEVSALVATLRATTNSDAA